MCLIVLARGNDYIGATNMAAVSLSNDIRAYLLMRAAPSYRTRSLLVEDGRSKMLAFDVSFALRLLTFRTAFLSRSPAQAVPPKNRGSTEAASEGQPPAPAGEEHPPGQGEAWDEGGGTWDVAARRNLQVDAADLAEAVDHMMCSRADMVELPAAMRPAALAKRATDPRIRALVEWAAAERASDAQLEAMVVSAMKSYLV